MQKESLRQTDLSKPPQDSFYLPMHGVINESSTMNKLRVVFDASAKMSSRASLNYLFLPGPSLYPLLPSAINKFRCHLIGMSSDISKMFREVALNNSEKKFHCFIGKSNQGN